MTFPPLLARLLIRSGAVRLFPSLQRRLDGGLDFLRFYSDRLLASPLSLLEQLGQCLGEETSTDLIDLASGTPRFEVPCSVQARLPNEQRTWPHPMGLPELRGTLAARLLAHNRLAFNPAEEILITAGAIGAAQTIFDAFVNRGDRVLLLDPSAPLYPLLTQTRGARVHWITTRVDQGRLRLRFDQLSRGLRGAKLLVLNSPASPTGAILSGEDLEQIAWWAARQDVLILADEVYQRFCYDAEPVSVAALPAARTRTLTVNSISKSHALASARVGWIAAHRHLLRPCALTAGLRSPFVPQIAQMQALLALRADEVLFDSVLAQFDARRGYVQQRLQTLGFETDLPAGGLFFWLRVPNGWDSGRAFAETLAQVHRLRVMPGDLFGPSGKRYFRLSYVTDDGRLEEGLNRIGDLLRGPQIRRPLLRKAA